MDARRVIDELSGILGRFLDAGGGDWSRAVEAVADAVGGCHKILVFGNGGSAAQAQHFAAELVNRFMRDRRPVPAMALTTDTSCLTAIGNDSDFGLVFSRQVEAHGQPGDVAIGLTTSGGSANVIAALRVARAKGLVTVALTGEAGLRTKGAAAATATESEGRSGTGLVDYLLAVPSASTPRIQEVHLVLLHLLAEEIENRLG